MAKANKHILTAVSSKEPMILTRSAEMVNSTIRMEIAT
jgi:hypothetical protein